jgi:hypothetical protein
MTKQIPNKSQKMFQRIFGRLEPWELWMRREISVEFHRRSDGKRLGEVAIPDGKGVFVIDLESESEMIKTVHSGDAELRVVDKDGRLIGIEQLLSSDQCMSSEHLRQKWQFAKVRFPGSEIILRTVVSSATAFAAGFVS